MATIADLRTAKTGFNDVADILAEFVESDAITNNAVQSTSSTSLVSLTQTDVSVVVSTGDIVHITISGTFSHSVANGQLIYLVARDTTGITFENRMQSYATSTGGDVSNFSITTIDTPSAGTYTYRLRIRTNTGTLYIHPRQVSVLKFKTA